MSLRFIKTTVKKYGWKAVVAGFVFYLVRDVVIYILIPWWIGLAILN